MNGRWFVFFSFRNPQTDKMQRFKVYDGFHQLPTISQRTEHGKRIAANLNRRLRRGWSPFTDSSSAIYEDVIGYAKDKALCPVKEADQSISHFCNQVLSSQKAHLRPDSIRTYTNHSRTFLRWLHEKGLDNQDISDLTSDSVKPFFEEMTANGRSNTTRNHFLSTMQTIFNHLQEGNIIKTNPFSAIKKLKMDKQGSLYFKKTQQQVLKEEIPARDPQLWLFVQFMYYCFIRPKELRLLKVGDIDIWEEKILIRGDISKNRKSEFVLIPPPLVKAIKNTELLKYPDKYFVFGSQGVPALTHVSTNHFTRHHLNILRELRMSRSHTLYSWKHTGVCMAVREGINLRFLQQQLRHHSMDQMLAYMKGMGILENEDFKKGVIQNYAP